MDTTRSSSHEAVADARRFGFCEADIAAIESAFSQAGGFAVFAPNASIVAAFLCGASQWRTVWAGGSKGGSLLYLGLDYAAVRVALDARGIEVTPRLWAGLTDMEMAARDALNGEG